MITIVCDHCKQPITEVVYVVEVRDAQRYDADGGRILRAHLHWDCLPLYGRSKGEARDE